MRDGGRPDRASSCATSPARRPTSRTRSTARPGRDLVFQTVDPVGPNTGANAANVKRMRYCLDARAAASSARSSAGPARRVPARRRATTCPGTGWDAGDVVVAETVVNDDHRRAGLPLQLRRRCRRSRRSALTCSSTSTRGSGAEQPSCPAASSCATRTALPIASFTATVGATEIVLNGSASSDPEGDPLDLRLVRQRHRGRRRDRPALPVGQGQPLHLARGLGPRRASPPPRAPPR